MCPTYSFVNFKHITPWITCNKFVRFFFNQCSFCLVRSFLYIWTLLHFHSPPTPRSVHAVDQEFGVHPFCGSGQNTKDLCHLASWFSFVGVEALRCWQKARGKDVTFPQNPQKPRSAARPWDGRRIFWFLPCLNATCKNTPQRHYDTNSSGKISILLNKC